MMQINKNWQWALLVCVLVVLISGVLYIHNPKLCWNDDFQSYSTPIFHDISQALSHGEYPLLSPWTWFGGDLTGEFMSGIFSVFELPLYWLVYGHGLTFPDEAAILTLIHLLVMALGMFYLARQRRLSGGLSAFASLAATFSGWLIAWGAMNWYTTVSGLVWLPWLWWGLEKLVEKPLKRRYLVISSFFIYLIITSGWHFAIVMGFIISVWLCFKNLPMDRSLRLFGLIFLTWGIGLGLSAPAWLPFAEYTHHTVRAINHIFQGDYNKWAVPIHALAGMIQPAYPSIWIGFNNHCMPRVSLELANGVLPIIFIILALRFGKRDFLRRFKAEILLAGFMYMITMMPSIFGFRWSFRWLPLFHMVVALLAAEAFGFLLNRQDGFAFIQNKLYLFSIACLTVLSVTAIWFDFDLSTINALFLLSGSLVLLVYGWILGQCNKEKITIVTLPILTMLIILTYIIVPINFYPKWNFSERIDSREVLDKNVRYLSFYRNDDIYPMSDMMSRKFGDYLKPGKLALLSQVECIQGYSPQGPYGLSKVFDFLWFGQIDRKNSGVRIIRHETGPKGLLSLMGVDGIVLSRSYADQAALLEQNGWKVIKHSDNSRSLDCAIVLERKGKPSPRVRSVTRAMIFNKPDEIIGELQQHKGDVVPICILDPSMGMKREVFFGEAKVNLLKEKRNYSVLRVENKSHTKKALVVLARAWYPGFQARFNGRKIPVLNANMIMPAVEIPPGQRGNLKVYFFPNTLLIGLWLAAISGLICFLLLFWKGLLERLESYISCFTLPNITFKKIISKIW